MPHLDLPTLGDGVSRPGIDPRAWVHVGVVAAESGGQKSVSFDDPGGNGGPNPFGVQVQVKLQPNGNVLPCRVSGSVAAAGAAEYHPFVGGDEVVVVVPGGDERQGGIIIGRLTQTLDTFPTTVCGQDVTQNNASFKRLVEPYLLESGTALILRVSSTGAALTLDPTGNTYLSSGSGAALFMRSDAVSLQLADAAAAFQMDPSDSSLKMIAGNGNTSFHADGTADSYQSQGTLAFSVAGNAGVNHAISAEAVMALLQGFAVALITACGVGVTPLTGTALAALLTAAIGPPTFAGLALVPTSAAILPPASLVAAALSGALAVPKSNGSPGVGSQGLLID